jgi:lipopolysaccharide export system permease protein
MERILLLALNLSIDAGGATRYLSAREASPVSCSHVRSATRSMNRIQRYLFATMARTVLMIVGGLALLAVLSQGLSQTDLIVENRQAAFTYLQVVMLGAPQIMALLLPIGVFIATIWSLNKLHRDSELVVAEAAGMTRWQVASPILRLAVLAALAQMCVNLWVQPTAQRQLKETLAVARADIATSLVRPGAFTSASDQLTLFTREASGGVLRGIYISDSRDAQAPTDYLARTGTMVQIDGAPAIVMTDGQIQQVDANGSLSTLDFDQYAFDLTPFLAEQGETLFEASDRYLFELFFPDLTRFDQRQDADKYVAEGHGRLSSPLVVIVMAMIGISAVLGGDFSRRGYGRRIGIATVGAIVMLSLHLSVQANSASDPALNVVQYLLPVLVFCVLIVRHLRHTLRRRGVAPTARKPRPATRTRAPA